MARNAISTWLYKGVMAELIRVALWRMTVGGGGCSKNASFDGLHVVLVEHKNISNKNLKL